MDRDEITYPREYVKKLGDRNLLGLRFPKEHGGRGLNWTGEIAALEEIGVLGTALGCAFAMPSIVGEALNRFGSDEQKKNFLRPLLKGDLVSAEALTEPRGGSDFFGATTRAELKNGTFTIKGQKRFVVAADGADFFIVYCNTNPQGKPHERISLILIEKDRPGVEVKYLYKLLGTRGGGTGRLVFRDVKVPESNLIGGMNQGASIFNTMMVPERLTSAGASLGMGRAALEVALRYSDRRKAFGQKIRNFQGVSFKAADAIAQLDSARALTIAAGKAVDANMPSARRLVSEAKKVATDAAWNIINLSMQMVGGIGYTNVYPIEKLLRDARLIQIWTGTNEIMNLLIQHELYREVLGDSSPARMIEADAEEAGAADEKVYEDEEMWTKGW
jgi:alkylation response protein AidB-like acyl-CoA dehydrogenase